MSGFLRMALRLERRHAAVCSTHRIRALVLPGLPT